MESSNIIAIHQPNFFPWLGYFYKIASCNKFVILDNVEFQQGNHNSITNRCKIKCNGEEKYFTVSVKKNLESKIIKDIKIDKQSTNIKKQIRTLQLNYAKAEHSKVVLPIIEKILLEAIEYENMAEANTFIIKEVLNLLEIATPIYKASELELKEDGRNERIIEICKSLSGNIYFSGNGGKKYHDEDLFAQKGITIKYTDFKPEEYKQVGPNYIAGLSTMDVLLNCGLRNTINMIKK